MEQILKDLKCMQVEYSTNKKKAILTFFDDETGEIRTINYNLQSYDSATKKYKDDPEKAAKCQKMIEADLGLSFETLDNAVGTVKDVYVYDDFDSLHPVVQIKKFTEEMVGEILQGKITSIELQKERISIQFECEGSIYQSNMPFTRRVNGEYFVDGQKKNKQLNTFKSKFLVPIEEKDTLIGHKVMVEVRDFQGHYWGDVKKFSSKK